MAPKTCRAKKYRGIKNTYYKTMYIELEFQSNIYITKIYGTMKIKIKVTSSGAK
jgi:hypothetical protein